MNNIIYEAEKYKSNFIILQIFHKKKLLINFNNFNIALKICENTLKKIYNTPESENLIIIQFDFVSNKTKSLQIEYEVYSESLQKLNLNYCQKDEIILTIPYDLESDLLSKFKLGKKDG